MKHKRVMTGFLKLLKMRALGKLCNHDGSPNTDVLLKLVFLLLSFTSYERHERKLRVLTFVIYLMLKGF